MGSNPVEALNFFFFGLKFAITLIAIITAMVKSLFHLYSRSSHHLYFIFLSRVKIKWPAPNIWVFIAQMVEHCSANAEAMGSNPVEALKFFFFGLKFAITLIAIITAMVKSLFHFYFWLVRSPADPAYTSSIFFHGPLHSRFHYFRFDRRFWQFRYAASFFFTWFGHVSFGR